jgi:Nif-specific regulatory protein
MNNVDPSFEIKRLVDNQKIFLDVTPDMVLIINGNITIEFMNRGAKLFFEKLGVPISQQDIAGSDLAKQFLSILAEQPAFIPGNTGPRHLRFLNRHIEYFRAPFHGFSGDRLQWLIMRDITEKIRTEEELFQFHSNIENILTQKIKKLKESEKIRQELADQLVHLKTQLSVLPAEDAMVGSSKPMRQLRETVSQVAQSDATILITGETGTGKELVANMVREKSDRDKKPFLKINCNTINDSLLESDLFGYEKGSFTGAYARTKGKFEFVDGGTVFLDEIGDISPRMQAALLRVLQDGEIIRVGGNTPIHIDVRIIAATNRDLALAVQDGTFRSDLYYRLNIIHISIPPLRQRKEDIEDLVSHFVRRYRRTFKKEVNFVPSPIIEKLKKHDWPGNVRELENVIQRAVLMTKSNIITEQEIFFDISLDAKNNNNSIMTREYTDSSLKNILAEVERDILIETLKRHHGNVTNAAEELKVGKTAFYDKLKRYEISSKGQY